MGDSFQYARLAYELSGRPEPGASIEAGRMTCQWQADADRVTPTSCGLANGHVPLARYDAIFQDRVGLPAVVALLMPLAGTQAFALASLLMAVAVAGLLALIVTVAGAPARVAVAAVVALFALPAGAWLARVDSEGAALAGIEGVCLGLLLLARDHRRPTAAALAAVSLAWVYLVRPSSALAVTATVGAVYAVRLAHTRAGSDLWITAGSVAAGALELAVMRWRSSPGLTETLQDLFTGHFATPDVTDLPGRFVAVSADRWATFTVQQAHRPWWALVALLGVIGALRWRQMVPIVGVVLGTAALSAVLHPVVSELPRLLSPAEVVVAVGLAGLLWRQGPGPSPAAAPPPADDGMRV
jgi:hypothetical protein